MQTIGFAGTAKNTGKTTSAIHVLELCRKASLLPALTSIGYDGENLDTITGLPKPRYHLQAGDLVATASDCLAGGTARLIPVHQTGVFTALGEVEIARVEKPGTVLLAGPNRKADLLPLLEHFKKLDAGVTFIDGALNRCVPLSAAGAILFATGAALDTRIPYLADHMAALAELFQLPPVDPSALPHPLPQAVAVIRRDGDITCTGSGSLLSREAAFSASKFIPRECQLIAIPGACRPDAISLLVDRARDQLAGAELVLSGPLKLLAGANPLAWRPVLDAVRQYGCRVSCLEPAALSLVTVNPFYPDYSPQDGSYRPAYVDATALLQSVAGSIPWLPVLDVFKPYQENILELLGILDVAN